MKGPGQDKKEERMRNEGISHLSNIAGHLFPVEEEFRSYAYAQFLDPI